MNVFVRDIAMARRYAYISDSKAVFLKRVWPGHVIVIFHHKEKVLQALTGGLDTIGMCMPDDPCLVEMFQHRETPITAAADGMMHGKFSTVIDFTGPKPIIIRASAATKQELDEIFQTVIE